MGLDGFTFIAQLLNFVVLVLLLKRFLYKPLLGAMDRRQARVEEEIRAAQTQRVEAEQTTSSYEERIRAFERDREQRIEAVRVEVESLRRGELDGVRQEIERTRRRWHESLAKEQQRSLEQFEHRFGQQLVDALVLALSDLADARLEQQFVRQFVFRLERMPPHEVALIRSAAQAGGELLVRTARPLDPDLESAVAAAIQATIGETEVRFKVASQLLCGIEILAGGFRVGWTLRGYFDALQEHLHTLLERDQAPIGAAAREAV